MAQIFTAILLTSGIGTALALILALLKPITRKVFSGGWHYYMWLVVLLVMVLPIRLNLPEMAVSTSPISETVTITDNQVEITETPIINTQPEQIIQEQTTRTEKVSTVQIIKDFLSGKVLLFSFIWLMGAVLLFLIKIINYLVFLIKIHKHSEVISCLEVKAYTNRKIKTRVSDTICSPLMIGIIKPTLLLPKTNITTEQLHNVLAHEMTHLKRNDILYKWFVSIVKCVHWFNPAIYLISKQINIDCEISCDLAVVKEMDEQQEKQYVETILSLLTYNNSKAVPLTTGMTGNKKTLKTRFSMIKNKIKISKKTKIISAVLAVALFVGTIFVSGIINGKFNTENNLLIKVNTDAREGNKFNFLMLGVDNANKVDTIMAFNFDGNILTCLNIPRNVALSVSEDVPANGSKNLSVLLSEENGDQKVIDAIKETLGIPVHYYAKVKMDAIADVVDFVGGIEYDIPYNMKYEDPAQDLHISLTAGKQVLSGKQVEHLLRFRDRQHHNGDEIRVMTWQSVVKAFLNQAVIGNKIRNLSELYEIATKNIKTNYSLNDLKKDFNNIKNINRNNIIIENIRGRNVTLNGYFVFHINYVESEPILNVFKTTKDGADLVSVITYTNKDMGFTIKLPELWKTKYEIIQFDNQVAFYHKDIFLKYGKGSGNLFRITKVKQPSEKILEEAGAPYEYLYSGEEYAYVWSVASDVQYPTWQDRDEEDVRLATDFENMMMDFDFIKNSFSLVDEESLFTSKSQNSVTDNSVATSTQKQKNDLKIKSSSVADQPYAGFEHLVLKNADTNKIKQELNKQGIAETKKSSVDLTKNYVVKDYSSEHTKVESDKNGNISLYFSVNSDNLFDVRFYDAETGEDVGSYGILANNENAYTFIGFEKGKTYNVEVQGQTKDDWAIEGNYIIY